MKILILTADYAAFLNWFYDRNPGLANEDYKTQTRVRQKALFGAADFYATNLRKLGHEAHAVRANDEILQRTWARDHGILLSDESPTGRRSRRFVDSFRPIASRVPFPRFKRLLRPMAGRLTGNWMYRILEAQIRHYKPDVILNDAMEVIADQFLVEQKSHIRLIVGQIAAPLPTDETYRSYDLVISSLPNYVEYFRQRGLASEQSLLAFEPSIIQTLGPPSLRFGATFVGSLSSFHSDRIELLDNLCDSTNIKIWGEVFGSLPKTSAIQRAHRGPAWGAEMFRILRDSRITVNHHIGIAKNYANNMRLYEATGVGTLLLTDVKTNLSEIFKIDREVVTYATAEECLEKIEYYLSHEKERAAIAEAGQQRTLKDHNYLRRMEQFVEIVNKYLCAAC